MPCFSLTAARGWVLSTSGTSQQGPHNDHTEIESLLKICRTGIPFQLLFIPGILKEPGTQMLTKDAWGSKDAVCPLEVEALMQRRRGPKCLVQITSITTSAHTIEYLLYAR